jgi:primosomal protein N' (replication factor Y) (superfamily II helicase)
VGVAIAPVPIPRRWVDVAIDAIGAPGSRTYTYHVPDALHDIAPGEAVIVEYGHRQALGIVLGEGQQPESLATKPLGDRVRSDGPLLAPLQLGLAAWISAHYLAPPAAVVRAMLPPRLLERLELVASPPGVPVRDLPAPGGRAALMRTLRADAAAGRVSLDWTLLPSGARPRLERVARLTDSGRAIAEALESGPEGAGAENTRPETGAATATAARLGERQRNILAALARLERNAPGDDGVRASQISEPNAAGALLRLAARGLVSLGTQVVERKPFAGRDAGARTRPEGAELTPAQDDVARRVSDAIAARRSDRFLLWGETAAGKTAVYAAAIDAAVAAGRSAIVLVPEIALALPLLDRLRGELGLDVAILHSALGEGERADEWRRIRTGEVRVVVGTRLAVLAPVADPGVIVVDEEHDPAYKSDRTPRYQARDVALELGRLASAPVLLGSATPDVISVGRARMGELVELRLPERVAGERPAVELVDLRAELQAGNRGLLSGSLAGALGTLDVGAGDRAILVLNRRGAASIILCRDCGYVQICPECQRPLVFHAAAVALRCHHCGSGAPVARRCPACGSPRIRYLGGGTERVEQEVRTRFPGLRVVRLDRDVAERKGATERIVDAFGAGTIDVLVGTSVVAKGLDIPEVMLVGVVSADVALNLPDERAAERTFQLLTQAVGRAGRGARRGRAIVQTYQPEHPAIEAVVTGDPMAFYEAELASRRSFGSPPFGSLVKMVVADEDRDAAEGEGRRMADELRARAATGGRQLAVLGPAPAYIARRAGRWRFTVILRGADPVAVLGGDPGPPWSVDVDPESLL